MACFIIPPYVLRALALEGEAERRAAALETLELSGRLAGQRMLIAEHPSLLVERGAGEQRTIYDAGHGTLLLGKVVRRKGELAVADRAADEAHAPLDTIPAGDSGVFLVNLTPALSQVVKAAMLVFSSSQRCG